MLKAGFSPQEWNSVEDLCEKLITEALLTVSLLKTLNWKDFFTKDLFAL